MDDAVRQNLAQEIRRARGSIVQRVFADSLGVSYTAVQKWEKGESIPDLENFIAIAQRLDLTCDELLIRIGAVKAAPDRQPVSPNFATVLRQATDLPQPDQVRLVQVLVEDLARRPN